jgi:anaerobic selenocysteine-containing dehydrogenase
VPHLIRGVCPHDCPDTCSWIVTVEDGRAVRMAGDPDHPFTNGFLCTKVARYVERTYHADRLLYPQIRVGAKGAGKFRRATWDEALALIAARLQSIIDSDGPQAILPFSYAGTQGVVQGEGMATRFFNRIGASLLDRTICASAGAEGYEVTYGPRMGTDPEAIGAAKLILLWGTNTLSANPHLWPFIRQAKANGATTICIDPLRTRTADACDEHIAIRPGTDAALALGMMHVIFRDGLEDRGYLEAMTVGWEKLRERVLGEYPPERVAAICRLSADTVERLGRLYGTTRPSFIRVNYGLQRHGGGGSAVRAIAVLPAVTGTWDDAGGGCQLSSSGTFSLHSLHRDDLIRPGTRTINMTRLGEALTEIDDPPVRALVVYNSNPASIAPERQKVLAGLRRDDLFTVVLEHFPTDTADYADVLLPATTQLEHDDLQKAYGHLYVMYNRRAIEPLGEALPNAEIFRRIAAAMKLDFDELKATDEELMREALTGTGATMAGITFEALRERGWIRLNVPTPHLPYRRGVRLGTASGKIEIESSNLAAIGFDPLPTYIAPHESEERSPELARRYPLALICPPAHSFLNSTFVNVTSLRRAAGKPTVEIHVDDAGLRGIAGGERVRVYNDRGAFTAEAVISDRVRPGVVAAPSVWWGKLTSDGTNANETTSQAVTDLGGGATFFDNRVEVAPSI